MMTSSTAFDRDPSGSWGWSSRALERLNLTPHDVADRVMRLTDVPDTPPAREIVALHLWTLDVSLEVGSPALLAPHLRWEANRWAQVHLEVDGSRVWGAVRHVLVEHLDELTAASVVRHVDRAEALADSLVGRDDLGGLARLSEEALTYLRHAVAGRHDEAVAHVLALADVGWSVQELLLGIVGAAQEELGRLWERGAISVAQEHMATAVTHLAIYALYPRLFTAPRLGRALVAATPPGDRHSVGLRVVSDLLTERGWDVHYVGLSCPVPDLIDTVVDTASDLLLLGASMTCHLPGLREAIAQVRADPRCRDVVVMVGGRPFRDVADLRGWVGADLVAADAVEAVEAAAGLVEGPGLDALS